MGFNDGMMGCSLLTLKEYISIVSYINAMNAFFIYYV